MSHRNQEQCQARTQGTASSVKSLVERARDGDRNAFEQLVDLFREEIFRMAYYRTRSSVDSEDLTQDIFMQAFTKLPRLKNSERFRTWLFTIGVNRLRDFHRKKRVLALLGQATQMDEPELPHETVGDPAEPLDNLLRKEFWEKIASFLGALSRFEREVFLLRFMDHLSIKEIAEVLRKSESAVKTHLYRALRKFRGETAILQLMEEER